MAKARVFAEKALELDPDLAAAHTSMGMIRAFGDWDFERAEKDYQRAIDLDPGYPHAHLLYGLLLASLGRLDEAIEQMEIGYDLDPLSFDLGNISLGKLYELQGREDRAIAHWEEKIDLAPRYYGPHLSLGSYYCRKGDPEKGLASLRRAMELSPEDPWIVANLGYCHAVAGREIEARKILEELEELSSTEYVTPVGLALIHVGLGEVDDAFETLERGYDYRSIRMMMLLSDSRFWVLDEDPRFGALIERIGLVRGEGQRG